MVPGSGAELKGERNDAQGRPFERDQEEPKSEGERNEEAEA